MYIKYLFCWLSLVRHSGPDPESSDFKGQEMDSGSTHCRNDRHEENFMHRI